MITILCAGNPCLKKKKSRLGCNYHGDCSLCRFLGVRGGEVAYVKRSFKIQLEGGGMAALFSETFQYL